MWVCAARRLGLVAGAARGLSTAPSATPSAPTRQVLRVLVVGARELPDRSWGSLRTMDPYCEIDLGLANEATKTKYISGELNPVWGEKFYFTWNEDAGEEEAVRIRVLDYDIGKVGRDDRSTLLLSCNISCFLPVSLPFVFVFVARPAPLASPIPVLCSLIASLRRAFLPCAPLVIPVPPAQDDELVGQVRVPLREISEGPSCAHSRPQRNALPCRGFTRSGIALQLF